MELSTRRASLNRERKRRPWNERTKGKSQIALQQRDIAVIRAVYKYRFLSTSQIAELFFPSKSKAISRFRELYDAKYLDRMIRPAIAGKSELLYALGKKGAELLASEIDDERNSIIWSPKRNKVGPEFLDHELAVNEVRLAFEKAAPLHSSKVLFWKYELDLKSEFGKKHYLAKVATPLDPKGELIIVNPDAYFGLATPKGNTFFFLELDRSTEVKERVFKRKLLGYRIYFEQGFYKESFGHNFFRVLTVTLTKERLDSLLEAANEIAGNLGLLFWFATLEEIRQGHCMEAIWLNAKDKEKPSALI